MAGSNQIVVVEDLLVAEAHPDQPMRELPINYVLIASKTSILPLHHAFDAVKHLDLNLLGD